jgi:hypothetical protein
MIVFSCNSIWASRLLVHHDFDNSGTCGTADDHAHVYRKQGFPNTIDHHVLQQQCYYTDDRKLHWRALTIITVIKPILAFVPFDYTKPRSAP